MQRFLPLLLSAVVIPPPAVAQDTLASAVIDRMAEANGVRVHARGGEVIRNPPQLIAEGLLVFPGGRSLRFEDIQRVDLLHGRGPLLARHGAFLGALLGGTIGFAAADGANSEGIAVGVSALGGGAVLGAAAGYIVGVLTPRTETIYQAGPGGPIAAMGAVETIRRRRGPPTTFAVTPLVGTAGFSPRTAGGDAGASFGLSQGQEVGAQIHYSLTGSVTARASASAINARHELVVVGQRIFIPGSVWLRRYAVGLELRTRANVPGYFLVEADGLHNPEGYLLRGSLVPTEEEIPLAFSVSPTGEDAGTILRLGAGLGYDVRLRGDRRLRFEWIYRVGRYSYPDVARFGYDHERLVRDSGFTIGVHLPLIRPEGVAR